MSDACYCTCEHCQPPKPLCQCGCLTTLKLTELGELQFAQQIEDGKGGESDRLAEVYRHSAWRIANIRAELGDKTAVHS